MKFISVVLISIFMFSFTNACDIRFIIQNKTAKTMVVDVTTLGHYATSKFIPKEVKAGDNAEVTLSVKPEMFDVGKKEKIALFIDNNVVTDIFIEFPQGSALLSAIAHDTSSGTACSQSISFISDQVCGKSTKWQNTIIVKPK